MYTNFFDNQNDEMDYDTTTLADLKRQKKKDTQANQKESVQKDRDDEVLPPVQKTTEDLNDSDSPPFLVKEAITIKGIRDVQILDLNVGILAFVKIADTFVCEQQKHKNITKMLRIVNSQPNKGLSKAVSGIECPKKHRVPIPDNIRWIDSCIVGKLDKFIGLHDIAKVKVVTWKRQGVPSYVTNKNTKPR